MQPEHKMAVQIGPCNLSTLLFGNRSIQPETKSEIFKIYTHEVFMTYMILIDHIGPCNLSTKLQSYRSMWPKHKMAVL